MTLAPELRGHEVAGICAGGRSCAIASLSIGRRLRRSPTARGSEAIGSDAIGSDAIATGAARISPADARMHKEDASMAEQGKEKAEGAE